MDKNEKEYREIHEIRYRETISRVTEIGIPPGGKILDVGSYPPDLFDQFSRLGYDLSGISSVHEPVERKNVFTANIETDRLPFAKNSFDAAFLFEVIEHTLFHPRLYLAKIRSFIKPGGKIFITTPNAVHIKHRLDILLGRPVTFPLSEYPLIADWHQLYYRHNREFTGPEVKEVLRESGFDKIKIFYFNSYTPFRTRSARDPLPERIVKTAGYLLSYFHKTLQDTIFASASV